MKCQLCETRKPRRQCAGVNGAICGQCCGEQREVTIGCPLDCEYLLDSRLHEKNTDVEPGTIPNPEIEVTEEFLTEHEFLLTFLSQAVVNAALQVNGVVDKDVQEALNALTRTYKTRSTSGLIFESRPENTLAAAVQESITANIARFEQAIAERNEGASLRDSDVLGCLVFLERLTYFWDNKRPKGRSFVSLLLRQQVAFQTRLQAERTAGPVEAPQSSLIVP